MMVGIGLKDLYEYGLEYTYECIQNDIQFAEWQGFELKTYYEDYEDAVYFHGSTVDVGGGRIIVGWEYKNEDGEFEDATSDYPFYREDNPELFDNLVEEYKEFENKFGDSEEFKYFIYFE